MGSLYLRARYYNVAAGAFFTEDSYLGNIREPLTLNRYVYCVGNPVNYADPGGHFVPALAGAIIGGISGLVMGTVTEVGRLIDQGSDYDWQAGLLNVGNSGMAGFVGGLAGGGMAGALSGTGLSMATQALLTGATAGVYGGSTARLLSGSGITPVTVTQDALVGGTGGLVTYGVASAYRQATAPKPSTTSLQERANLAAQLSEAEGCADGSILALQEPFGTNPWLDGSEIISTDAPKDCYINMALAPGQTRPGGWGTFDNIPNIDYVRNNLAVTPEFKPEIGYVQRYLVPEGTPIQTGIVGPQSYNGVIYPGGGNQVQILNYSDRANLVPIGVPYAIY